MDVPDDPPERCPVCDTDYESVSRHEAGVAVNLLDNERYRRVCFEPVGSGDAPELRFYHHTHEQAGTEPPATEEATPAATTAEEATTPVGER